jgi:hypothetical protein
VGSRCLCFQVFLKARATSQSFLGNLLIMQSDKGSAPDYYMYSLYHDGAFVRSLPCVGI